jgi:transposase
VGPIGAMLLRMKAPDPGLFQSGRQFAAWIGLTPKDQSTAGKVRLGVITRAGDEGLRSVLVVGAIAVIRHAQSSGKVSPWLLELLKRKSPKLAAVALANKTARIARGTRRNDVLSGLRVVSFERRVTMAFVVTGDVVLWERRRTTPSRLTYRLRT